MWSKLYLAQDIIMSILKAYCPIDTGALSQSIRPHNEQLIITIGDEVVDYAPVTNESWDNFPKLRGKKNPNEGWIEKALTVALPIVENFLHGEISKEEAEQIVLQYNGDYQKRLSVKAKEFREKARMI